MICVRGFLSIAFDAESLKVIQSISSAFGQGYNMILGHEDLLSIFERIEIKVKMRLVRIFFFGKVDSLASTYSAA